MTRACLVALAAGACALPPPPSPPAADRQQRIAIIASERGPQGFRLVAIDEHGDRRFELVAPPTKLTQDRNPTLSPDGRWMVFASTRERGPDTTSLWIAPLQVEATPRRLTDGPGIDSQPIWKPDGSAIVFASTRDGGDFDLWQLAIGPTGKPGALSQLTTDIDHEIQPTVARDGTIAYVSVTPKHGRDIESRLIERAPDGTIRTLTNGPADTSPAFSPDGKTIVFARPVMHEGTPYSELWRMARGSDVASPLVVLPITDESGPVWSRDGRFVFATSALRIGNRTLFSSVVHVDLHERQPRARILVDRAGAVPRLTPAISTTKLDVAALHGDPEYLPELARIMAAQIAKQAPL